ncbi:MAG: class I SAM-dependent methyltransferase [Deltaproteobacteria bacterium]|nr:class I SAM-dependent methyltransferase [Deltaproteobacteria bacterium]
MSGDKHLQSTGNGYTREEVTCNICKVNDEELLYYAPERIVRCKRCGLLYCNPRPDTESLEKIYSKDYFVIEEDRAGIDYKAYANYIEDEPVITRSMLKRMKKVERFAPQKGHLLDIGCATGFSLMAARERGWKAEGIECSKFCVDYARSRGLTVHQGSLNDYTGKEESMDAITMWDYLEHSPDPFRDLTICHSLLKPGGIILLSIPNVDSWSYFLLRKKWIGFKNIEHLYFFSRTTLEKLARQAGFTMEHCFYHGKYVSLSFFLSRIQYYMRFKILHMLVEKIAANEKTQHISFYFNPYDILNVVLRK